MTAALASISPAGWVGIVVAWIVVACAVAPLVGRAAKDDEPEVVRATYPPPVPPTQAEIDAMWVEVWPTDVWLTAELASRKCREILAIEGLS